MMGDLDCMGGVVLAEVLELTEADLLLPFCPALPILFIPLSLLWEEGDMLPSLPLLEGRWWWLLLGVAWLLLLLLRWWWIWLWRWKAEFGVLEDSSVELGSGEGGVRDPDLDLCPFCSSPPTMESMEKPILGLWAAGNSVEVGAKGIIIDLNSFWPKRKSISKNPFWFVFFSHVMGSS